MLTTARFSFRLTQRLLENRCTHSLVFSHASAILPTGRLQNSPYFCVFKYARAVKQKVWNEGENRERDWGETRALRARNTLTPRFADFVTDFEEKNRPFCNLPNWMTSDKLMLKSDKTELLVLNACHHPRPPLHGVY